jgi:hypothetical protein
MLEEEIDLCPVFLLRHLNLFFLFFKQRERGEVGSTVLKILHPAIFPARKCLREGFTRPKQGLTENHSLKKGAGREPPAFVVAQS